MSNTHKELKEIIEGMSKPSVSGSPRLSSFKGIRDLSKLIPSQKPPPPKSKRVFKPNIVARKTKNERAIEEALKNHGKTLKKSEQAAFRGRTHTKTKEVIQLKGSLFDDKGLTAHRQARGFGAGPGRSNMESSSSMQQTKIKLEPQENVSCEDFFKQFTLPNNPEDDELDPGMLPHMICMPRGVRNEKQTGLVGSFAQLKVKSEAVDIEDTDMNSNVPKTAEVLAKPDLTLSERVLTEAEDLICFSFPGVVPGILEPCQIKVPDSQQEESGNTPLDKIAEKQLPNDRFRVKHINPGQIGSLKVYRSGKVEMVLNGHRFDAWEVPAGKCHKELAYVKIDNDKKGGRLSLLGNVSSEYSFIPNVSGMIGQKEQDAKSRAS